MVTAFAVLIINNNSLIIFLECQRRVLLYKITKYNAHFVKQEM